jgi:lysozyme family protein
MKDNFDAALAETLLHEGGWAKHPDDPGGSTMRGITKATYEAYLGRSVTDRELKDIPDDHIRDIYKTRYWDKVRGDDLPSGLDMVVFDFGVNSGPARAARHLQAVVGASPDGAIGPKTMAALDSYIDRHGLENLIKSYSFSRLSFLRDLKTWRVFGRGWERRVMAVERKALTFT